MRAPLRPLRFSTVGCPMGDLASPLPVPPSAMTAPDATTAPTSPSPIDALAVPFWVATIGLGAVGALGVGAMLTSKPAWAPWAAGLGLLGAAAFGFPLLIDALNPSPPVSP